MEHRRTGPLEGDGADKDYSWGTKRTAALAAPGREVWCASQKLKLYSCPQRVVGVGYREDEVSLVPSACGQLFQLRHAAKMMMLQIR